LRMAPRPLRLAALGLVLGLAVPFVAGCGGKGDDTGGAGSGGTYYTGQMKPKGAASGAGGGAGNAAGAAGKTPTGAPP
jgi:hypothetical protein